MAECPHCGRPVPEGALFCYADGRAVGDGDNNAFRRFRAPLILPSGRPCGSFDELVKALLDDWAMGRRMLRDGDLEAFMSAIGRTDLAREAREAAGHPDADVGLDLFLRALPGTVLRPAELMVTPAGIDLGRLRVGAEQTLEIQLANTGMGLLHGSARSRVPWLVLGEDASSQRFAFHDEQTLTVRLRGSDLRAAMKRVEGEIVLDTSAGTQVLRISADVPPAPFASGVLAGALTPRQVAEKARANPREAARLFENGAVARWYTANGWAYPVDGEPATGLAAVQQFFDALGLSKPPRLTLSETAIDIEAPPGETVRRTLRLSTPDKRPLYARAHSDKGWLLVRGVDLDGDAAEIHLAIPSVPDWPGEKAAATVVIHANCRQRLEVPVTLSVPGVTAPLLTPIEEPVLTPLPRRRRGSGVGMLAALAAGVMLLVAGVVAAAMLWPRGAEGPKGRPGPVVERKPDDIKPPDGVKPPPEKEEPREVVLHMPREEKEEAVKPLVDPKRDIGPLGPPRPRPVLAVRELARRPVEIVFCIDTTGSMGRLLRTARAKVWSLCSQIARGKPTPDLKIGLLAYRDKGDEYITKVIPMSRDLDAVHAELDKLVARGGGDIPESVNEALFDCVNRFQWSKDPKVMKIIFLVGDAPPHMDYKDDVKYPVTCKEAVEKGIIINTIQCGRDSECRKYWKDIAAKGGGEYVGIPQDGGLFKFDTPFDEEIVRLGHALYDTVLPFGTDTNKRQAERALGDARRLTGTKGADRAVLAALTRSACPNDLLDALRPRKLQLADFRETEIPDVMKKMKMPGEREAFVTEREAARERLREEILALEGKRAAMQKEAQAKAGKALLSFDGEVLGILRKQAKKFEIEY